MAEHLGELRELALEYIPDGEEILDAVDVEYAGKVNLEAPMGLEGLADGGDRVRAGADLAARIGEHPITVFPSERQMALVLAEGRVLVWSRGGFRGKPKAFLGEVPFPTIEQVTHEDGVGGQHLVVKMWSGWQIHLEMVGDGDGEAFGSEFAARVAAVVD